MFDLYDILIAMAIGLTIGFTAAIVIIWWDNRRRPETFIYGERL